MHAEHNSYVTYFRDPFYAVPVGEEITLRVMVFSYNPPAWVHLYVGDTEYPMYFISAFSSFRVYEARVPTPKAPGLLWYYFHICADGETKFLGAPTDGYGGMGKLSSTVPERCWQITTYEPFKTPKWFQKAVFYQIFPDSFKKGGNHDAKGILKNWKDQRFYKAEQFGGEYLANDMYGGDLDGITASIPYLKSLGVSAVYLNPIFESPSNHKYDTSDYENVDAAFGGNQAFDTMIEEGEKNGIRFMLDGVFNHTGSDSRYFNKNGRYPELGAYQSQNSPYYSWYNFMQFPHVYSSWWGFQTLPDTNDADEEFRSYILTDENSIVRRWLKAGASGWRLDVADELSDDFIKLLRKSAKEAREDAVILGEVWEDASNKVSYNKNRAYFFGRELDGVMNYPLKDAILKFVGSGKDAWSFVRLFYSLKQHYPPQNLYCCLNFLSSHDTERALSVLGGAPPKDTLPREKQAAFSLSNEAREKAIRRLMVAYAILFTLPGAPCVFYGDERGMEGLGDPFNRSAMPWEQEEKRLFDTIASLAELRNKHDALSVGEWIPVYYNASALCYLRIITDETDALGDKAQNGIFLIAVNVSETESVTMPLDLGRFHFKETPALDITVPPLSYIIQELH